MDDGGSDDGDGDNIFRWVQSSELLSLGRQSLLSVSFKGLALKQSPGQTEVRVQSWPCPCKPHWWILGRCRWFALGQEDDWKRDSQPRERAWTHTHTQTHEHGGRRDRQTYEVYEWHEVWWKTDNVAHRTVSARWVTLSKNRNLPYSQFLIKDPLRETVHASPRSNFTIASSITMHLYTTLCSQLSYLCGGVCPEGCR